MVITHDSLFQLPERPLRQASIEITGGMMRVKRDRPIDQIDSTLVVLYLSGKDPEQIESLKVIRPDFEYLFIDRLSLIEFPLSMQFNRLL